ncbi:MAG: hypothetical protein GXO27_04730 [Chlorobi bacterium]|nr:hypothetical protein [Chlorobiota bacterium]
MKRTAFFVFWWLVLLVPAGAQDDGTRILEVYVMQDGRRYLLNNRTVEIRRKPFTLVFVFKQPDKYSGVYVNTSYTPTYFKLYPSQPIPDFLYLPQKVLSEYKFNPRNELKVHPEFFQYFGYNKERNWFKFNKIDFKDGFLIGYRKVENLYIVEENRTVPVEENKFPLYMFFVILEKTPGKFIPHREVVRFKGKIKFK